MDDADIQQERAQNIWNSTARKFAPFHNASHLEAHPEVGTEQIGGLAQAQEEVLTCAYAMTRPEVYARWGTHPPSGILLIGRSGCGKSLLARALATRARTAFLRVDMPRLALEIVHQGGQVGDLLLAWSQTLDEMPPTTLYFQELEFFQAEEIGGRRSDLPIGPIMDFFMELIDRATGRENALPVGGTRHPDTLRPAFIAPGRFERIVEVTPQFPDDVVAALEIHARAAEGQAGRTLFGEVDWKDVVSRFSEPSTGDWIRLMHGVLRRKARHECSEGSALPVTTEDLLEEVERYRRTRKRLPRPGASGTYV